jgi:hypothetical protein
MRELRLAKVFEDDDDSLHQTAVYTGPSKSKYASVNAHELGEEHSDDKEYDIGMVDDSRWSRPTNRDFV